MVFEKRLPRVALAVGVAILALIVISVIASVFGMNVAS